MEGPSKAEISFEDRKDGSCGVSYIVKEPGRTFLSVEFSSFERLDLSVILLCFLQFM